MLEVFAPKDIEGLSKLAGLLTAPFFAAAVYVDHGLWVVGKDDTVFPLLISGPAWLGALTKAAAFFMGVLGMIFAVELSQHLLLRLPRFYLFVGFSLLTFGVLGLGLLFPVGEPTPLNAFWHLGCLCWGLDIFGSSDEKKP